LNTFFIAMGLSGNAVNGGGSREPHGVSGSECSGRIQSVNMEQKTGKKKYFFATAVKQGG
jgi:hypothetical protein